MKEENKTLKVNPAARQRGTTIRNKESDVRETEILHLRRQEAEEEKHPGKIKM